jgi:hypothetical protein
MVERLVLALVVLTVPVCRAAPRHAEVDLIREPARLSQTAQSFAPGEPVRADGESVRLCVHPGPGYQVSGRWTVLTPSGREALVVGRAELANGRIVNLASPSAIGNSLCVQPRLGGPLEAPLLRVRLATSTPIVVERIVWESACR